jgi:hypothetical protein
MKTVIANAIDWLSVKLCGVSTTFLFITGDKALKWLGIAVMVSTVFYNGIRIYKELKSKA